MRKSKYSLLYFFLILSFSSLLLIAEEKKSFSDISFPKGNEKSRIFQDSGSQVDSVFDRIRFKISYSWMKAGDYFRAAFSAGSDLLPAKKEELKQKTQAQKEALMEKGKDMLDSGRKNFSKELDKAGDKLKEESAKEIDRTVDGLKK